MLEASISVGPVNHCKVHTVCAWRNCFEDRGKAAIGSLACLDNETRLR